MTEQTPDFDTLEHVQEATDEAVVMAVEQALAHVDNDTASEQPEDSSEKSELWVKGESFKQWKLRHDHGGMALRAVTYDDIVNTHPRES